VRNESNLRLARVTILGNQVAGMPSEHDVFHFTLTVRAKPDHFVDVNKMVVVVWPEISQAVLAFEIRVLAKLRHSV
jgi:hypothetical protein